MSIVAQENLLQPSLRANSFRLLTLYTIRIRVCSTTSPARFKQFVRCLEEGGEKVIYIDRIEMTQQVTIHFPHPPSSQRKSKESHLFTKTLLYISSAHFSSDGYLWPTAVLSHRDNSGGQGASIVGAQHPHLWYFWYTRLEWRPRNLPKSNSKEYGRESKSRLYTTTKKNAFATLTSSRPLSD